MDTTGILMSFFPLFHNTKNLKVLLVGGGIIAKRRATGLLRAGVSFDVVATYFEEGLPEMVAKAGGTLTQSPSKPTSGTRCARSWFAGEYF